MKNKLNNSGIGLIEVIAALGVAMVITTSLVALSLFTLRTSLKSKLILEGSNLASKELELVRAYRDKNTWSIFVAAMNNCKNSGTDTTPKCYMTISGSSITLSSGGPIPPIASLPADQVSRGFYVLPSSTNDLISVQVVTQWREGTLIKTATLRADFTDWQNK